MIKPEFKIEKDVPMPAARWKSTTSNKEMLLTMEIGDSFFVEGAEVVGDVQNYTAMMRRLGLGAAMRSVEGGIRVWRTA